MWAEKILKIVLLLAAVLLGVMGVSSLVGIHSALWPRGVAVKSVSEANELTAVYGGVFSVLSALCLMALRRPGDRGFLNFIAFAFLFVGATRVYAAIRYGIPDSPRIYASLFSELFFGLSIFLLNRSANPGFRSFGTRV